MRQPKVSSPAPGGLLLGRGSWGGAFRGCHGQLVPVIVLLLVLFPGSKASFPACKRRAVCERAVYPAQVAPVFPLHLPDSHAVP
jgi:hypothetical protein